MNLEDRIAQMARSAHSLQQLTLGFSAEQARWKPDPDTWSVVEVMNHLYFEERMDFRAHLARGLGLPTLRADLGEQLPYAEDNLAEALAAFLDEREQSLAWLRRLETPDWEAVCKLKWGEMKAGDMMVSWAAHDILHLRQLVELHYAHMLRQAQPYSVAYAGEW